MHAGVPWDPRAGCYQECEQFLFADRFHPTRLSDSDLAQVPAVSKRTSVLVMLAGEGTVTQVSSRIVSRRSSILIILAP